MAVHERKLFVIGGSDAPGDAWSITLPGPVAVQSPAPRQPAQRRATDAAAQCRGAAPRKQQAGKKRGPPEEPSLHTKYDRPSVELPASQLAAPLTRDPVRCCKMQSQM